MSKLVRPSIHPSGRMRRCAAAVIAACSALVLPRPAGSSVDADLFLFTTSVSPNVAILMDNSGSMNNLVWHPKFDPTATPTCAHYNNDSEYSLGSNVTIERCGNTRTVYHDPSSNGNTRVSGRYLNWLFSDAADAYQSDIDDSANGTRTCSNGGLPVTYAKYQRNRMTAAKQVVLDTICRIEAAKSVRFGLSVFREPNDSNGNDPNGGYLRVGIADSDATHKAALETAIVGEKGDSWTPLGETLFQIYTYFMGRSATQQAAGVTSGTFPIYDYSTSTANRGGAESSAGPPTVPGDPIQYSCQKNFVIIITDGEATRDDFDAAPSSTAAGFSSFGNLIGNYDGDSETETPGDSSESGFYLDDIAKFMHEEDMRPDITGTQSIDTYTIGFTTAGAANTLLSQTADNGNGIFFTSNNAEELTEAIVKAVTDIIEKSQSFTAATVPSTRTAAGGDFYTSFFLPNAKSAFWQGHLRAFGIDAVGNLFDSNNACPLTDPDAGECNSGPFVSGAAPFWDAGNQVPTASSRKLYTTTLSGTITSRAAFTNAALTYTHLDLQAFAVPGIPAPNPIYPGSKALNAEGLSEEIISYVRGCEFGTGVSGSNVSAARSCTERSWRLGDIFHSAPVIVGSPNAAMGEPSYSTFATTFKTRPRVIYAGANDGFLHAFAAGAWQSGATPPGYDRGTGVEVFGFMPWESRKNVKQLYIDDPTSRQYYVDGSPQAADVWIHPMPTSTTKAASGVEWRSYLFGGLREGGRTYYALDVTDPSDANYPGHVWDFPPESDPDDVNVATSILPYLGESWSQPIITRVRVAIDGDDNLGDGYERWVMIVSGGYSANGDPNDRTNYDATAIEGRAILMVDVKTGELLAMKKFEPGAAAGDPQRDMVYAIASTPAVYDLDFDGFADVVLVGDLGGQLWKWVISDVGEDRVNDSSNVGDYTQPSWPLKKFFAAPVVSIGADQYYKSIFFPPSAGFASGNLWYSFGTGERNAINAPGDASADENNRIYTLRDDDPFEMLSPALSTLDEASLTDLSATQACTSIPTRGFFFKLADGEKVVTNIELFAGFVLVGTFMPSSSGDPCTAKGTGKLYVFNVACGGAYFNDSNGAPQRGVSMGDGMPTDPQVSVGVDGKDNIVFIEKSGADLESLKAPDIPSGGKTLLYWREIY